MRASASPDLPVVSLAKRDGGGACRHARPGGHPLTSEALYLLQRVRDEAHRFAITYHRKLRDRSATRSVLDGHPRGGGDQAAPAGGGHWLATRRAAQASLEELEEVPGSASLPRWSTTICTVGRPGAYSER